MKQVIESLELELDGIECEIREYFPPILKFSKKYDALLELRKQYVKAIRILKFMDEIK